MENYSICLFQLVSTLVKNFFAKRCDSTARLTRLKQSMKLYIGYVGTTVLPHLIAPVDAVWEIRYDIAHVPVHDAPMFPEGVGSSCGSEVHVKEVDVPPVDAEGLIEFRSLWYFGIPVSLQPSVELDVAHCAEFLLGRGGAELESAQFRRVRSMDQTKCALG